MYFLPLGLLTVTTIFSYLGAIPSKLGSTIGLSLVIFLQDLFKVANQSEGYRQAGTNRIQLWLEAINAISQKPILGFGPDMMIDRWGYACVSMTPHNEYLECALYMGIPGLVMYLGGLITLFVSRVKRIKKLPPYMIVAAGAIIAYLVSAFFGVRKYHTVDYLFMFIGLVFLKDRVDEKTVKSGKK
jgi:O-antigen ligase